MGLKRVLCAGLALLLSVCTVLPLYAEAADLEELTEVQVTASEEEPFTLYAAARPDSEVTELTEETELQISEAGEAFSLIQLLYEDGETVSGYVQTGLLNEYAQSAAETQEDGTEAETPVAEEDGQSSEEEPDSEELDTEAGVLAEEEQERIYLQVPEGGITLLAEAFQNSEAVFTVLQPVEITIEGEYRFVAVEHDQLLSGEETADYDEETAGDTEEDRMIAYASYEQLEQYLPEDSTEAAEEAEMTVVEPEEILEAEEEPLAAQSRAAVSTAAGVIPTPVVLDISKYQAGLTSAQYDQLAAQVGLVIVRVSDGTSLDTEYKTHIEQFKKRGVPIHVYMYMRKAYSMDTYMKFFYDNAKDYDPVMYWLDFELSSFTSSDVSAAVKGLRSRVGDAKVGIYISHHLYETINPKVSEVDAVWIPRYGNNTGYYDSRYDPNYTCDIHQYTSAGRLTGYNYDLDLSRLTLTNGKDLDYFSVKQGVSTASEASYFKSNPGKVTTLTDVNVYSSTTFKTSTKTGKKLAKGTTVTVTGMAYTSAGTPRLKVDGGYITANKKYVGEYSEKNEYYTSNPGAVKALSSVNIYNSVTFKNSTKTGKKVAKGTTVNVTGIAYTNAGTPRLKVSGGYITANKKYVSQVSTSSSYYTSNPGSVTTLTGVNLYSSVTFKDSTKTGKKLAKGTTIKATGIAYTNAGTPRLKVDGGYITANKKYVSQYYTSNPGKVKTLTNVNVYSSTSFKDSTKTGKKLSKGTTVTVSGIAYSSAGTPRLKVNGGYITANVAYVSK